MTQRSEASSLTQQQRIQVDVAALTATGKLEQLKMSLQQALDQGITINELKEILIQMYAYTGFPRCLNGLATLMSLLDERKGLGIHDLNGPQATALPNDKTALELGSEIQTELVGKPVSGALFDFAPAIDQFLKAHLFGDIFGRGLLNFQQRELITVAALSALGNVNSQLASHMRIAMHNGLSTEQLQGIIEQIAIALGSELANNAQQVLDSLS
jgi:4-carboxymuconolactone decarboxylase